MTTPRTTPSQWRRNAIYRLSDPRYGKAFLTFSDIVDLVDQSGGPARTKDGISNTVARFARELCGSRDLIKIQRDLYANLRARPAPKPEAAAHLLRKGAVVSLQTVLGQAGVANNPTNAVYALYPLEEQRGIRREVNRGKDSDAATEFGRYRFIGVKREFLEAGDKRDRLADADYPKATPERALLDWIRLAEIRFSGMPAPPLDFDIDLLDRDRLDRLAHAAGMDKPLEHWLAVKAEADAVEQSFCIPGVGR